ncbi:MAG: hypothetical protein RL226_1880 [Bacteroidota bacterium]
MKTPLLFDFQVDKTTNTIRVQLEFDAGLDLVWRAWTTPELLDQWWAPLPYRNQTKELHLKPGGFWLYAMISPENDVHWCRFDYESITPLHQYAGKDAFCDELGQVTAAFPGMHWTNTFSANAGRTMVQIVITPESLEALEKIIEMGFKEGFTMGLNQLDEMLTNMNRD